MRGMQQLRRTLADWLTDSGLDAVAAWGEEKRLRPGRAVAAVSLREVKSDQAGFQNYLGEQYDEAAGQWEERYGKRMELTFGLDLSAATAEEVQAGVDTLRDLLDRGGPGGMVPAGFSAGETVYDQSARRYLCPAQAKFRVWAVAVTREDGSFLDFEVKGETNP